MSGVEVALVALVAAGIGALFALAALGSRKREDGRSVSALVEAQSARLDRLAEAIGGRDDRALREGLGHAREILDELRVRGEERMRSEESAWEVIRRLDAVLVGGGTRGRAGENVLEEALGHLPPDMVVRGFRVGGKEVEFALVLPDGRRLPVDSKWTALHEVASLETEEDPRRRQALCRHIENEVAKRAREVASYLDPALTTPFAVACVPDPAYAVCRRAHADAFARGVVLAPYSTAVPLVLALHSLAARHGRAGDLQSCLVELEGLMAAMEQTLENKVARALTTLHNAANEWRTYVGKARGALARGRGGTKPPSNGEALPLIRPATGGRLIAPGRDPGSGGYPRSGDLPGGSRRAGVQT
jgi:RmuC family